MGRLTGFLGLACFLAIAYAWSSDRKAIHWKTILWGLGLHQVGSGPFEGIMGLRDKLAKGG